MTPAGRPSTETEAPNPASPPADIENAKYQYLGAVNTNAVMVRSGPTGGSTADVEQKNTIVAGTDPIAIDAYAARAWWNLGAPRLRFLAIGEQLGLGRADFESVRTRVVSV